MNKDRLKEIVKTIVTEESEYQVFFKKALEKAGKSITSMSDEEKKAFFNKIDAAWDGKGEKNEELTGNQHKLDVDGDGEIEASDLAKLRAKKDESVNESTLEKGTKLRYEKNTFVVDYVVDKKYIGRDGYPKYILKVVKSNYPKKIKVGSTEEYEDARLTGLIRNRVMSFVKNESVNEEFKHTIYVDNPRQVASKKIADEIEALAKKGIRSKEIGLKMGFVGNQKAATDAFQKIKNKVYFSLHKDESVNESLVTEATDIYVKGRIQITKFAGADEQMIQINAPKYKTAGDHIVMTKTDFIQMLKNSPKLLNQLKESVKEGGDLDVGHQDDEPNMLKSTAFEIAQYASKLVEKLDNYDDMPQEVDFPNWWQAKLILAKDYLEGAYHYLNSKETLGEGRAFINAAKKAKAEGKTEFEFNGKTYPVTIKD